jgi:hypothetical protein
MLMLSIAMIAAALLIAGFVMRTRASRMEAAGAILAVDSASMLTSTMQATPASRSPEIVALVLRVPNLDCACDNARKYVGKTFRLADAPAMPLKECTRADCRCRYERIAERRNIRGERRTKSSRREEIRFEMKDDRRSGKDRRQTNNVWKQPV